MATRTISPDEQQSLEAVNVLLRGAQHPHVKDIATRASELANPGAEAAALTKFNEKVAELQKTQNITKSEAMERVRKDDPGLQKELHDAVRRVA